MKRLILLITLLSGCALAQNPAQPTPAGANGTFRVVGYVLTNTPTNICTLAASAGVVLPSSCNGRIFYVCSGDVNASVGTAATITIKDGVGNSFWNAVPALSGFNGSSFNIAFGAYPFCRPFPSGIVVSSSLGSVVTLSISGYY